MASGATEFPFGIIEVVELLHLKRIRNGPNSFYVDCPFCNDGKGRMNVNYVKHIWRCNHCGESGGMLSLYARVNRISVSDAYREICDSLSLGEADWQKKTGMGNTSNTEPSGRRACTKTEQGRYSKESGDKEISHSVSMGVGKILHSECVEFQEIPQSERAGDQEIHQTYSLLLNMLSLTPKHKAHLMSEKRGLTEAQIMERRYKSTPTFYLCRSLTERLIKQGCTVQGVPGFFLDEKGRWTINFNSMTSGILIPSIGIDGLIKGMQLLLDVPLKDKGDPAGKKGAKYIWLSSYGKNLGTTSGSQVHFIGDPFARTIYVTEGLLKADIAHYHMNRSFAAVAGANNLTKLDALLGILANNGTEQIVEAYDMDKFSNEAVANGKMKICQMAAKHGMKCISLTWNPNYKGVDDWQLALKRRDNREKEVQCMPFKEQYLTGMCDVDHVDDKVEEWHRTPGIKQELSEYLGLTEEEYYIFVCEGNQLLQEILDQQRIKRHFRFYQLDFHEKRMSVEFAFKGIGEMRKAGYQEPPSEMYRMTYESEMTCPEEWTDTEMLRYLHKFYGEYIPEGYRGRALAASDIVELYDQKGSRYYYVDIGGFEAVSFSPCGQEVLTDAMKQK